MEHQINEIFRRDNHIFRLLTYCDKPTVMFEDIETKERFHCAVGSIMAKEFIHLKEERMKSDK